MSSGHDIPAAGAPRPTLPRALVLIALALVSAWGGGCGDSPGGATRDPDDDIVRWRVARLFARNKTSQFEEAARLIQPLVERAQPEAHDLVRAATIALALEDTVQAGAFIERAHALAPDDPAVAFNRGNLLKRESAWEAAVEEYRTVLRSEPDNAAARLQLGEVYGILDRVDDEIEQYDAVRERGVEYGPGYYRTAIFKLSRVYIPLGVSEGDDALLALGEALNAEAQLLKDQNVPQIGLIQLERAGWGSPLAPEPRPPTAEVDAGALSTIAPPVQLFDAADAIGVDVADLDRDGTADVFAWGPGGLVARFGAAPDAPRTLHAGPVAFAAAGDLDESPPPERPSGPTPEEQKRIQHPALELLVIEADGAQRALLLTLDGAAGDAGPAYSPLGPGATGVDRARAGAFLDYDHDGDLDLALATADGARLLRNDGADERLDRTLVDATPDSARALGDTLAVIPEDLDSDQDVDLLVVRPDDLRALSSLRGGAFEDATDAWGLASVAERGPGGAPLVAVLDLDADGRPDVVTTQGERTRWQRRDADGYAPAADLDHPAAGTRNDAAGTRNDAAGTGNDAAGTSNDLAFADLDLDGDVELLRATSAGLLVQLGPLTRTGAVGSVSISGTAATAAAFGDLDADGDLDLVELRDGAVWFHASDTPLGRGLVLHLEGRKDNSHGIGAIVEVLAGETYRRLWWRGEELPLGLGPTGTKYEVRATWPNGVVQFNPQEKTDLNEPFVQVGGEPGSCPFLYTWNGETFEFVSDVLGATPLGLPFAPGMLVPPDHEEYVKVRGEQLVPDDDGVLRIALTEELREVTYLDRVRLHAIDHPAETEVQPDEAFVFPPFPPHHVHTLTDVRAPARVTAHDGSDVTERIARVDGRYSQPWTPLPSIYHGLAEPWHLDITLAESDDERAALAAAPRIRLALTGWLRWGNASVNMAAARHPTYSFEVPRLWLPDGDDWRPGPPIGFPTGKTKTMVVDVTELVDRDDPRLRIGTTLQLSWDAIRVVLDDDDAPYRETPLEPVSARVTFRGFSRPLPTGNGELPQFFDWDERDLTRWDQHPGMYTRYGGVLPLLQAIDDRFVIFGSGDVVFAEFAAAALPPLPAGWTRDWLLYLDGWAKDGDPNTLAAEQVEPLPFHGMSAYPPPAGESYPTTPEHDAYRREWNTRPAARLIVPLVSKRLEQPGATHDG